jgi:hypothetical protein
MNFSHHHQRGAGALIVAFGLACAMLLAAVLAQRNLVFAQRSSVNQQRSTLAYEAAEAGLNWAQAQLNQTHAINDRCETVDTTRTPTALKGTLSFAQRHTEGSLPVAARCVHSADRWACHCAGGDPEWTGDADAAFSLQIKPVAATADQAAALQVIATGCDGAQMPCTALETSSREQAAQVRLQVQLARIGGLQQAPTQAITLRDGAQTPAAFFAMHFGLDQNAWKQQPVVKTVRCEKGECLETLSKTLAATVGPTLLRIEGDVDLDASTRYTVLHPALVGTAESPVTLVVSGKLTLRGPLHIQGVLYASSIEAPSPIPPVTDSGETAATTSAAIDSSGVQIDGAVLAENSVNLVPSQVLLNTDVMRRLQAQTGTLARVAGTWKDF